jgi:hypothetical protein
MKSNIFLLGDSVLNNSQYVPYGNSVCSYLHKVIYNNNNNNNNNNLCQHYCFAENNATIYNVYNQFSNINISFNNEATIFYISVGGNDILKFYDIKKNNLGEIEIIFEVYKKLIESIKSRFPFIKLGLLNIYFPLSNKYQIYWRAIKKWNDLLYSHYGLPAPNYFNTQTQTQTQTNSNIYLLNINEIMNSSLDFTNNIEPSITGGEKIAKLLFNNYNLIIK